MKIVNRGFIIVRPRQPFIEWANEREEEFNLDSETEPNIYLIDEDFFEVEPVIEANFKKIFKNELSAITDNEEEFPVLKQEIFELWFDVEVGSTVFDILKADLKKD